MLKNKFKMITVLFIIISLLSVFSLTVKATDATPTTTTDDTQTIADDTDNVDDDSNNTNTNTTKDEIVYGDLYLFDTSVTMDKTVDGNVYIVGQNVKITGKINGNLFVFGNKVEFTTPSAEDDTTIGDENYCYIAGTVYACANELNFNAIAQDLYAAANNFNMDYKAYIMRDVRLAASDIIFKGYVTRDVNIVGNKIDFGTPSENSEENDAAYIGGNLNYSSSSEIEIPDKVVVGKVNFSKVEESEKNESSKGITSYLLDLLGVVVYTIVIYLIFNWLTPNFFERTAVLLKTSTLPTLGIGFLGLILPVIVGIILLCFTLVSLSVTLFTVYGLLIALCFTTIATSITYLLKDKIGFADKKFLLLIIVTIVLWALKQIPFVGGLITFAITVFGLGLIINNIIKRNKPLELNEKNA